MTKSTNLSKKGTPDLMPFWRSSWTEMDKAFENFRRELEKSFSAFPTTMPSMPKMPETSCDVIDEGNQLVIKANIPGIKKNEIELNVTDNSIEISAQHKAEKEEKKKNYLRKERSEVSYYRTIPLPEKVKSNQAKAKLTDGVLSIEIPKTIPTAKPKKKSIRVQ
jgi:HSP20 family protein